MNISHLEGQIPPDFLVEIEAMVADGNKFSVDQWRAASVGWHPALILMMSGALHPAKGERPIEERALDAVEDPLSEFDVMMLSVLCLEEAAKGNLGQALLLNEMEEKADEPLPK